MFELILAFGAIVLVALLVLNILALYRLSALARERDASGREAAELRARLDAIAQSTAQHERDMRDDLASARREQTESATVLRREVGDRLAQFQQGTQHALGEFTKAQSDQLHAFGERLSQFTLATQSQIVLGVEAQAEHAKATGERLRQLTESNAQGLEAVRATVEQRLDVLRAESADKLEQMRATVDEKLQNTLEQRLGTSFKLVSDRLEQVHKGLGEMQSLATGVGDLKRVLTNVKTRGGWGEVQLGSLLEEMLTPQQYERNVATRRGSSERVELRSSFPDAARTARNAGCRSTASSRSTIGSAWRMRWSGPTCRRPTQRANRSPNFSVARPG